MSHTHETHFSSRKTAYLAKKRGLIACFFGTTTGYPPAKTVDMLTRFSAKAQTVMSWCWELHEGHLPLHRQVSALHLDDNIPLAPTPDGRPVRSSVQNCHFVGKGWVRGF